MKIRSFNNPIFSTLDTDNYPPSIANLPAALTINGITVMPTLRYNVGDANGTNWAPWGYGETLTLQAGTAPTYNNGSPLLGSVDDSVKFNAGGYYQAGNNTFADITTEDFVVEVITNVGFNSTIFSKSNEAGNRYGYICGSSSTYLQSDRKSVVEGKSV